MFKSSICCRLEPVIIKLERQRAPVIVVCHEAVLRASYAYFADSPLKEIPHTEVIPPMLVHFLKVAILIRLC
ncbi:putative 6-phosphofructo-2-kinase, Fructose-2,6-bisphosphate 2-phosphatase [Helianthus anomalus]